MCAARARRCSAVRGARCAARGVESQGLRLRPTPRSLPPALPPFVASPPFVVRVPHSTLVRNALAPRVAPRLRRACGDRAATRRAWMRRRCLIGPCWPLAERGGLQVARKGTERQGRARGCRRLLCREATCSATRLAAALARLERPAAFSEAALSAALRAAPRSSRAPRMGLCLSSQRSCRRADTESAPCPLLLDAGFTRLHPFFI